MINKLFLSLLLAVVGSSIVSAQSYDREKQAWVNYVVRAYNFEPFDGVRVVADKQEPQLISVVSLAPEKYSDFSQMSRVAAVKAQSQATRFFSGSTITNELIIKVSEDDDCPELTEITKERSVGYVKNLQLISNFDGENGKKVFIYSTPVKANQK